VIPDAVGSELVRRARNAIGVALGGPPGDDPPEADPAVLGERRGVFVTLRRAPGGALRGCIGYPLPTYPLGRALSRAAVAAATEDPRFPPVSRADLARVTVEVSVLTPPTPVPADQRPGAVRAGTDGLIVESGSASGLLLPQVATEMGWDAEALLDGTCEKAGLPAGAWRDPRVHVLRFEAEVFNEETPGGPPRREPPEAGPEGSGGPGPRSGPRRPPSS
jgi:uncharacterized protein